MSNEMQLDSWYLRQIGVVLNCLRRDWFPILLVTLIVGICGGLFGKWTNTTSSSAQLLLTPVPLTTATSKTTEDDLAEMIAQPMDIRTAALLCKSDEVLSETRDTLNSSGKLESPVKALQSLNSALSYEISVAKESPMQIEYSPILRLSAKGDSPEASKLIVDTWADICVKLAKRFQEQQHTPAFNAFQVRTGALKLQLDAAEERLEEFRRDNSLTYYQKSIESLITRIALSKDALAESEQDYFEQQATFEHMANTPSGGKLTQQLNLNPSDAVLNFLSKQPEALTPETPSTNLLSLEVLNPLYELETVAAASAAGFKAQMEKINEELLAFAGEMKQMQIDYARIEKLDRAYERELTILEKAYQDAALKTHYAEMAAKMKQPALQILSHGAQWRMPRFRRAIAFGCSAAMNAFILAMLASVLIRLVIRPALETKP
jgi:hypothetical protein